MNDYQMTYLAGERRRQLHAEAERARLARPARAHKAEPADRVTTSPRRAARTGLGALLGRSSA